MFSLKMYSTFHSAIIFSFIVVSYVVGGKERHQFGCIAGQMYSHQQKECISCPIGYFGINCSLTCPEGYFGNGCQSICPEKCNKTCDLITGGCKQQQTVVLQNRTNLPVSLKKSISLSFSTFSLQNSTKDSVNVETTTETETGGRNDTNKSSETETSLTLTIVTTGTILVSVLIGILIYHVYFISQRIGVKTDVEFKDSENNVCSTNETIYHQIDEIIIVDTLNESNNEQ